MACLQGYSTNMNSAYEIISLTLKKMKNFLDKSYFQVIRLLHFDNNIEFEEAANRLSLKTGFLKL